MVSTYEAHRLFFTVSSRENVFTGSRLKLRLKECKLEWIFKIVFVCICVCGVCVLCVCVRVSLDYECLSVSLLERKERVMFTFGACVSANFGCTSFFDPCWGPFTSSWCSFCSTSWSKPGCCLRTALMRKTPEDRHNRDACYSFLKMLPTSCIQELINAVKRCSWLGRCAGKALEVITDSHINNSLCISWASGFWWRDYFLSG